MMNLREELLENENIRKAPLVLSAHCWIVKVQSSFRGWCEESKH
jgi:hypothetical protein